MATYYARDGTPVETAFALPVNSRGEVDVYRGRHGKQRLYTKARLDELNRRDLARRKAGRREPTMSEHALATAIQDFEDFLSCYSKLVEGLQNYHHMDPRLAHYWAAINVGCPLSRREARDAWQIIRHYWPTAPLSPYKLQL